MKSVAFVTASEKNCGIYYYGKNVCDILSKSTKYNFFMMECDSEQEFHNKCNADIAIFNYHPATLSWYNPDSSSRINQIQFMIEDHSGRNDVIYHKMPKVKEVITMNVISDDQEHYHPGVRPIIYYDNIQYKKPNGRLKIGTDGVGGREKHLDVMISLLNQQFFDPIDFCIHFSVGTFADANFSQLQDMIQQCKNMAAPNINVNFICNQLSDLELVEWLNQNDINIYCYSNYDSNAVSSAIDKALAAKKPIGVNNSNFFKHVYSSDISISESPIIDIINRGITPLEKFYDMWNPDRLIKQYENLVDKYN